MKIFISSIIALKDFLLYHYHVRSLPDTWPHNIIEYMKYRQCPRSPTCLTPMKLNVWVIFMVMSIINYIWIALGHIHIDFSQSNVWECLVMIITLCIMNNNYMFVLFMSFRFLLKLIGTFHSQTYNSIRYCKQSTNYYYAVITIILKKYRYISRG